jgi:hypothetical protein
MALTKVNTEVTKANTILTALIIRRGWFTVPVCSNSEFSIAENEALEIGTVQ